MPERTPVGLCELAIGPDGSGRKELGHSSNWSKLGGTPGEGMLTEAAAVASAGSSSAWLAAVCAADFHPQSRPRAHRHAVRLRPDRVCHLGGGGDGRGRINPSAGRHESIRGPGRPDVKITSIHRGIIPFLIVPLMPIVLMFLFPSLGGCWTCFTPDKAASSRALEAWPDSALGS
jgi:hypothetical protein